MASLKKEKSKLTSTKHRKELLCINNNSNGEKKLKELLKIRGDVTPVKTTINLGFDTDLTIRIMKKKKCGLFINVSKEDILSIGRTFNDELIDFVGFKITSYKSASAFDVSGFELMVKYFVLVQNLNNSRLENLMVDLLCTKGTKITPDGIRYAWIFAKLEGKSYVLKFVRVLKDLSVEECGPLFELELTSEYHCNNDIFEKALNVPKPSKKNKNIERNAFKDQIGTIHINKQDLRDVKIRRTRSYKNKAPVATKAATS